MSNNKVESSIKPESEGGFFDRFFVGDKALWIIIIILAVVSLLVVYSSTASMVYRKAGGDTSHYFFSQLKFLLLGFAVMFVVSKMNYQRYMRYAMLIFILALLLMALTFIVGVNFNHAARWIRIPIIGITFQPSDFLRISLVILLAQQLATRQKSIEKMKLLPGLNPFSWSRDKEKSLKILKKNSLPILGPIAIGCAAIFFSNFSTAAITFFTCWIMLYIGRVRVGELMRLMFLVVVTMGIIVSLMSAMDIGRSRTWTNRIKAFAGIENTRGAQSRAENGAVVAQKIDDDDLQKEQARIAIASGQIGGKGPGNSTQRSNLPHAYSDFAYAFIIEEYGLVGAMIVLFLYLCVFFRGIATFHRCGTAFPSLMVLGLCLMITMQALVNMLVSVGIFPVTGQTLPLISLGGSSVVFTCVALGMVLGVSRQVKEQTLDSPRSESLLE